MIVKFTNESKKYNLFSKSAMLSILVFSVGTSSVLASEISTPTPSSTAASVNVTQDTTASLQASMTLNESETETPNLIPGDFFYFVKTMYENIQLALTVNDVKEARMLAAFAQERLAEANALLAKGKTNEANLSLQKSLETQQNAIQKTEQASGLSTTEKSALAVIATPSADVDAKTSTTQTAANPASEQTAESEQTEIDDMNYPGKEVKNPDQVLKVKTDLQHNILALTSALGKVGNPKAQSALMKNIEKSFAHLDKKLSKIERKTHQWQTNEEVTATAVQQPVATLAPTAVPTAQPPVPSQAISPVRNEPVSVQEKHEDSFEEHADHTNKSKNNSQHGSSEKKNGKGHDKNKG